VRLTIDILYVAPGGEGVGRTDDGRAVFVSFTAPGERIVADVPGGTGPAHATLVEVVAPGPDRVLPPCPHFGPRGAPDDARGCGGCEWMHLGYAAQAQAKARSLAETLQRIGRLEPGSYEARPIITSPTPLRYRSRAKFHLDRSAARLVFFRRRSHDAVLLSECHLLELELDLLREEVGPALVAARVDAREVTLEWSAHQRRGAAHLQLVALGPGARAHAEAFLEAVPSLSGAVLTADGAPPVVLGDPVLLQERRPGDAGAGVQRSRPDVFQQANRGANALLVEAALALLRPEGEDVLELFCGAGNFTAPLAARARTVAAVEVQGPALELARRDGSANVRFYAGDALAVARGLARDRGPVYYKHLTLPTKWIV
jgi:23S rRNA (uracil1939-C5)-methyltransferase